MRLKNFGLFASIALLCVSGAQIPVLAAANAATPALSYRIAHCRYLASDLVVAAITDADLKLDRTGATDSSAAIQKGLDAIGAAGGGTLFLSEGIYRLDAPLVLPSAVTLRGELGRTSDPYRYQGTILAAYTGEGAPDGPPLITLGSCCGLRDCMVWYPRQSAESVTPYPPAVVHNTSSTCIDNVVFINAYQAYRSGYKMSGRAYVRNLRGTALSVGVEIDGLADTGRVENVDLSPQYWIHSGLPGAPKSIDAGFARFMQSNGVGVLERRIDWTNTAHVSIDGYNKGYATDYSKNEQDLKKGHVKVSPNGENFDYKIANCVYGVYLLDTANAGLIFTRFNIKATTAGFYMGEKNSNVATLLDSVVDCPINTLDIHGAGRLLIRDCEFRSGSTALGGGVIACSNSKFGSASCQIVAGDGLINASLFGNSFARPIELSGSDTAKAAVHVDARPVPAKIAFDAPQIDYLTPRGASAERLWVITNAPFSAVADGTTDCAQSIQAALTTAGKAGGGIVYVPAGVYAIAGSLTIPPEVELRGAFGSTHDANTAGSCLMIQNEKGDPNGQALIDMGTRSTLRGLNFHYAKQDIREIVDFPFLIRGNGAGIVITHIACANVSRFIDLMTHRCDGAFVDHIEGQPIHIGVRVGGGSRDVVISDCQFNPSNWTFSSLFNAPKVLYPTDGAKRGALTNAFISGLQQTGDQFVLGDCTGLRFYRDFVFAGRYGIHFVAENGRGPSGVCLEPGVDGSTCALRIDAIGQGGFPVANSQLVVTNGSMEGSRHDIESTAGSSANAFFYGVNAWGAHTDSFAQALGGTLRVDGAHLRDPGAPAFDIHGATVAFTASCVRRDLPLFTGAGANIVSAGNILPDSAPAALAFPANLIFTDPEKPAPARK
ncbi:MAG: glycosyl hydrolase family 28-related protein [Capsulimonadaceae bacterium]|nr:glycosyl hydrolase family 28-related protein [Capsulimonadaceae bacterium]